MAERLETRLEGPVLVEPRVFRDERGFFQETYRRDKVGGDCEHVSRG